MNGPTQQTSSFRSSLKYEPRELEFGTSGRRGKVVDLTQLEVYINALAELEYLQSLDTSEGGIVRGQEFFFARDLRPSSDSFVPEFEGRGEIAQAIVAAIGDAGMRAINLGAITCAVVPDRVRMRSRGIRWPKSRGASINRSRWATLFLAIGARNRQGSRLSGTTHPSSSYTPKPCNAGGFLIMVRSMTTSLCALIPCSRFGGM